MIKIVRWIIAIPAGIAASFLMHMFSLYSFSLGHGYDDVSALLDSIDMNGMPLRGTYILLFTRLASSAALVGCAVLIVPKYKKKFGIVLAVIVSIFAISLLIFLMHQAIGLKIPLGPSVWYRNILEMIGVVSGSILGAYIGLIPDKQEKT